MKVNIKVYIVETGEYDDIMIQGLFSTREIAQEYVDKMTDPKSKHYDCCFKQPNIYSMEIDKEILQWN